MFYGILERSLKKLIHFQDQLVTLSVRQLYLKTFQTLHNTSYVIDLTAITADHDQYRLLVPLLIGECVAGTSYSVAAPKL